MEIVALYLNPRPNASEGAEATIFRRADIVSRRGPRSGRMAADFGRAAYEEATRIRWWRESSGESAKDVAKLIAQLPLVKGP